MFSAASSRPRGHPPPSETGHGAQLSGRMTTPLHPFFVLLFSFPKERGTPASPLQPPGTGDPNARQAGSSPRPPGGGGLAPAGWGSGTAEFQHLLHLSPNSPREYRRPRPAAALLLLLTAGAPVPLSPLGIRELGRGGGARSSLERQPGPPRRCQGERSRGGLGGRAGAHTTHPARHAPAHLLPSPALRLSGS